MTQSRVTYRGGRVFDGAQLHENTAARFQDDVFVELVRDADIQHDEQTIDLNGGILSPGFVDLQVNGGGGVMFNDDPSVETLQRVARAHFQLGATTILPTLITDTPEKTRAALNAVRSAVQQQIPGIAGVHLEGPHLSRARKGAHDAAHIRPMEDADLQQLLAAKADIPVLKVTVAPENVSVDQVSEMARAGILVSLGHSDADFETCRTYADAGARCVTHLFNAMSQLGNREPGLVGAALAIGTLSAGLIADAVHVHPATMRNAWHCKARPGEVFLVSDSMAVAGTEQTEFALEGRQILRRNGTLTLSDGTLAGADLDLATAIGVLVRQVGIELADALRAATTAPGGLINLPVGLIPRKTTPSTLIVIDPDLACATPLDLAGALRH